MNKFNVAPLLFLVAASAASAQGSQFETSLDYGKTNAWDVDIHQTLLSHQWFVDGLADAGDSPWREAAFSQRQRSFSGFFNVNRFSGPDSSNSANVWGVGAEYMAPHHNYYGAAQLTMLNGDGSFMVSGSAGYFLAPQWLVKLDLYRTELDQGGSDTDLAISTKTMFDVLNGDTLVLNAAVGLTGDQSWHQLSADYYMRPWWSVGIALNDSGPGVMVFGDSIELRSEYVVMPQLALRAGFARVDVGSETDNQYRIGASYRY